QQREGAITHLSRRDQSEGSPTPQSGSTELAEVLRRDRRGWLRKPLAVGRAVGLRRAQSSRCEGGLARSAWKQDKLALMPLRSTPGFSPLAPSAAEAARQVGYESPSQFSRKFKWLFGGTSNEVACGSRSSLFAF